MPMSDSRRLHPIAMVATLVKMIRSAIIPLAGVVLASYHDFKSYSTIYFTIAFVIFCIFFVLPSFLTWYRFMYRVDNGELKIEHGIFVKKHRYIRKERIQSIDRTETIFHRPFGLVKVKIETAGGGAKDPEAELAAVTKEEARRLEEALYGMGETAPSDGEQPTVKEDKWVSRRQLPTSDLLVAGATSGKIGVVFSILAAISSQIDEVLPDHFYSSLFHKLLASSFQLLAFLLLIVAIGAWILAIVGTVLRYNGFTLTRKDKELRIVSGLLERRQLTISLHRIQAIRIVEGILRQPFGYAAVYVESAGGSGEKDEDYSTVLFPLLRKKEVAAFLDEFVPGYPLLDEFVPAPKRAISPYLLWLLIPALVIAVPVAVWVPWGGFALFLLPLAAILGVMQYRDTGWSVSGKYRVLRFRKLSRTTVIVPKKNIQDREMRQSFFQKRNRLATYEVSVISKSAGKHFRVKHINENEVRELLDVR